MVRVTLRPDVPDVEKKFNQDRPLDGIETATFFRPSFKLPPAPPETVECTFCDGRGYDHDCPSCQCICDRCHGEGSLNPERQTSTLIGHTPFALNYARQVLSLPEIELAGLPGAKSDKPLLFRFSEGVGALMPLRSEMIDQIDIELRCQPVIGEAR